jgi:hypothetical protein
LMRRTGSSWCFFFFKKTLTCLDFYYCQHTTSEKCLQCIRFGP